MKRVHVFTKEDWLKIAKMIDTEYIDSDSFEFICKPTHYFLTTNKCDNASLIRCFTCHGHIIRITRVGPDTESWQEVHDKTYDRINIYLSAIDAHLIDPSLQP